eukprot:scaffold313561_cov19-Tisochrysis_lutea.AAC.1
MRLKVLLEKHKSTLVFHVAHALVADARRRRVELFAHRGELVADGGRAAKEDTDIVIGELVPDFLADSVPIGPARVLVVDL